MKIMTAGKYDLDTLLETKLARAKAREEATEEEIAQMDLQEKIAALEARLAKTDSKMAEKLEEASRFKEEAELKSLESKIHPAFNQYRFAGKLGDADAEHHLDEMLWTKALSNLEQYDEVTHEAIVKEFSAVAKTLDKVINKKVESKTKEVSKERKRNAKTTAQMQQVRGYVDSDLKKEAATKIRSGNLTDILKNWDRFGKLF
jgi:molybdopterin converting factor small subunit